MYKSYEPSELRAAVTAGSFWQAIQGVGDILLRVKTVRYYGYKDDPESAAYPENYWVYWDGLYGKHSCDLARFMDYYKQVTDPDEIEKAVFERAKYRGVAEMKRELGNKHVKHLSKETKGLVLLLAASN